jgi:hypothetical protein
MRKILSLVLATILVFAMGMNGFAMTNSLEWKDAFGFHCNAVKGNGKVVTGFEKATVTLTRTNDITTWELDTEMIECPACKRLDWVTFSNKNGVINGKNIQVNHSGVPNYYEDCKNNCPSYDGCEKRPTTNNPCVCDCKCVFVCNNPCENSDYDCAKEKVCGDEPDCDCSCDCETGEFAGAPCTHERVFCDKCKNGNGNNTSNCEGNNPEGNTNYFCFDCGGNGGKPVGAYHKNHGWENGVEFTCANR